MKVYEVARDSIYMRGEFRSATLRNKEKMLSDNGITAVVCTLQRRDEELAESGLVRYINYPLPDARYVDCDALYANVSAALNELYNGGRVLVHCIAGRNRSGLVSAILAAKLLGLNGEEAFAQVRRARPESFTNKVFEQYVKNYLEMPQTGIWRP